MLNLYWQTTDSHTIRLYHGDVIEVLSRLPPKSVHCVVTSPPYWGLRNYGTNDPREIGSERTPQEYVDRMAQVFRFLRKVLRDDGTLWLNIGDTYASSPSGSDPHPEAGDGVYGRRFRRNRSGTESIERDVRSVIASDVDEGNLVGIPWRVAFALQDTGWILRQEIIWHKPDPMPESCTNRCTKAHEQVFLFTKSRKYYFDSVAIQQESVRTWNSARSTLARGGSGNKKNQHLFDSGQRRTAGADTYHEDEDRTGSNKRSVWTIPTGSYPGAHFATFPKELVEPCILAGTSEKGCCARCGKPWVRILQKRKLRRSRPNELTKRSGQEGTGNFCPNGVAGVGTKTLGWKPSCYCGEIEECIPCTVLDPFIGSGTTASVCISLRRRCWGIDLSEEYLKNNTIPRVQGSLRSIPALFHLAGVIKPAASIGEEV